MAGSHTSSKFTDVAPRTLESSRLLAPTKASMAKAKATLKGGSSDSDVPTKRSERLSSPTRSNRGNTTDSHSDASYSSDDDAKSLKRGNQLFERRRGSVSTMGQSEGAQSWNSPKSHGNSAQSAAKKYSDSVRLANAKGKSTGASSPGKQGEGKVSEKSHKASNLSGNRETVKEGTSDSHQPVMIGTRVPIWPDLNAILSEKAHLTLEYSAVNRSKSWAARAMDKTAHDGYSSPVSTLEFRMAEDSLSPASTNSNLRPCILEQSDSDADSDKKFSLPRAPEEDTYEPLEFASLDFIGDVEGMEQDLEYVRQILVSTGFSEKSLPQWFSSQSPINPSIFEKLEVKMAVGEEAVVPGNHAEEARLLEARRQRMLLFDAVNEALGRRLLPYIEFPIWVKPTKSHLKPRPVGKDLLKEVWSEIHEWPVPTSDEVYDILDDAARRDMVRGLEKWNEFGVEESEVVFDLESLITQKLIEEAITSFTAIELKHLKRSPGFSQGLSEAALSTHVK